MHRLSRLSGLNPGDGSWKCFAHCFTKSGRERRDSSFSVPEIVHITVYSILSVDYSLTADFIS